MKISLEKKIIKKKKNYRCCVKNNPCILLQKEEDQNDKIDRYIIYLLIKTSTYSSISTQSPKTWMCCLFPGETIHTQT